MRHNIREVSKVSASSLLHARGVDWSYWQLIPRCKLYEAVYLAMDIDPKRIDFNASESVRPVEHGPTDALETLIGALNRWLDISENNLSQHGGGLESIRYLSRSPLSSEVSLNAFGVWACSSGLDLPSEFPQHRLTQPAKHAQSVEQLTPFGSWEEYSPEWSYWRQLPVVKLGEAVCLSMAVNPKMFEFHSGYPGDSISSYGLKSNIPNTPATIEMAKEFVRRAKIAERNIATGQMVENEGDFYDGGSDIGTEIKLSIFRKWAEKTGWVLPGGFPQNLMPQQERDAPLNEVPDSELSREELIMKEVERRCYPDKGEEGTMIPKGEKASMERYFKNKHDWTKSVFDQVWKKLAAKKLVKSEHTTN